jgi:hypothetical protein
MDTYNTVKTKQTISFISALISRALHTINLWHHCSVKCLYPRHSRGTLSLDPPPHM